jgi:BioD-like phosphotransacetylase family protein
MIELELTHSDVRNRIREGIAAGYSGLDLNVEIDKQFKARVAFLVKAMKEIGKSLSGESEGFLQKYGLQRDARSMR